MSHPSSSGSGLARVRGRLGVLALALLQGCAINPYIANPRPAAQPAEVREAMRNIGVGRVSVTTGDSLAAGTAYADALYDGYEAKLSEEFERQRAMSGGLLTLGALAVALAAGRAHTDALLLVGIGGGLAYQLGTWNTSKNRLGIYIEGMKAVSCAKAVMAPMHIGFGQLERVRNLATAATNQIDTAGKAAGSVTAWLTVVENTRATQAPSATEEKAKAALVEFRKTLNETNDILSSASSLERRVENANAEFTVSLDRIRGSISDALNGTLADVANLPKAIGSLNDYASVLVPGIKLDPAVKRAVDAANIRLNNGSLATAQGGVFGGEAKGDGAAPAVTPIFRLAGALGDLQAATALLSAHTSSLKGAVEGRSADEVKASLAGCGVDMSKLKSALVIDRPVIEFRKATAGTAIVNVSGGTAPYSASLVDLPAKGISISAGAGGATVVIAATAETEAGQSYKVRISDAAGVTAFLTISIEGTPGVAGLAGAAGAAPRTAGGMEPVCKVDPAVTFEDRCLVQARIGTAVDGKFFAQSCRALWADTKFNWGGSVTVAAVGKLKTDLGLAANAGPAEVRAKLIDLETPCPPAPGAAGAVGAAPAGTTANAAPAAAGTAAGTAQLCGPKPAACRVPEAQCALECSMTDREMDDLRAALKLPAGPREFTSELRGKIREYQQSNSLPASGQYTAETAQKLRPGVAR